MLNENYTGWARVRNTSRRHYFKNGISLCSNWRLFMDEQPERGEGGLCRACMQRRRPDHMKRKAA